MEKFIITPKEDKSVTMTIRIDRALQEEYNDLAAKTNRSRNELIAMLLVMSVLRLLNKQAQSMKKPTRLSRFFAVMLCPDADARGARSWECTPRAS